MIVQLVFIGMDVPLMVISKPNIILTRCPTAGAAKNPEAHLQQLPQQHFSDMFTSITPFILSLSKDELHFHGSTRFAGASARRASSP
jgi:hypothetical protein